MGRELELETLIRLFERSRTTPSVEVVTIVAEPGIGKSRLVRELSRHVDGLPDLVTWRSGRCLPYGDGIGFWALAEIVAAHAGILETDDQATLSAKLDAVLTEPDPEPPLVDEGPARPARRARGRRPARRRRTRPSRPGDASSRGSRTPARWS